MTSVQAYIDCFAGASGNMFLGALLDAGVPESFMKETIENLGLENVKLVVTEKRKRGIVGKHVEVRHPEQHVHRHLSDIVDILNRADLGPTVKDKAVAAFQRLATAEARAHSCSVEQVHFHEVGAVDAIVDVVCTMAGFDYLQIEKVHASPVHLGTGFVDCAHGTIPVPVPATLNLLEGVPTYSRGIQAELVTPTGAALLTTLAETYGPQPGGIVVRTGYGAGTRDLEIPNLLRLTLLEDDSKGRPQGSSDLWGTDQVTILECNLDDDSPEFLPPLRDKLLELGALDAYTTSIIMKFGRPATQLTVLCPPHLAEELARVIFAESTTLGIRVDSRSRYVLPRESVDVTIGSHRVSTKVGRLGKKIVTVAPELKDCRHVAEVTGLPLKEVYEQAKWEARKLLRICPGGGSQMGLANQQSS